MLIIALGSNLSGPFGSPKESVKKALDELEASAIQVTLASKIYNTEAVSYTQQDDYVNAIAIIATPMSAEALLQVLKRIEAQAGRARAKTGRHLSRNWMPRPLDLDIVSYKGRICNWKMGRAVAGSRVILPHPRAHERAFVLRPLMDVAPQWHHPVFGLTAAQLLKRPQVRETGAILGAGEDLRP